MPERVRLFKDPWSATTHFAGLLAALAGALALLIRAEASGRWLLAMGVYAAGLVGLFLASSVYHFFDLGERWNPLLRRLDHAAIFLFIACCYAPPALALLGPGEATALLVAAGALGIAGAAYKLVWFHAPLWVDMTAYLGLGWLGVLVLPRALHLLPLDSVGLFLLGGLLYTLGAVVFILERPDPLPGVFGHHEVWHLFVLGGAVSHYAFNYGLLSAS